MGPRKKDTYYCDLCGSEYSSRKTLYVHKKNKICTSTLEERKKAIKISSKLPCKFCNQKFRRQSGLNQHVKHVHSGAHFQVYLCGLCPKFFKTRGAVQMHRKLNHVVTNRGGRHGEFVRTASAHRKACEVYRLALPDRITQPAEADHYARPRIMLLIRRMLVEKRNARVALTMNVRFRKIIDDEEEGNDDNYLDFGVEGVDVLTVPMTSSFELMRYMSDEEEGQVTNMFNQIDHILDSFVHNGSGWIINNILGFDVQVMQCHALAGACGSHSVQYRKPDNIKICHADEDTPMDGNRCFYRAVAASIIHTKHNEETAYKNATELELEEFIHANICENVMTPVSVADIGKFEEANSHLDIAINVMYEDEDQEIYPVRASSHFTAKFRVNLLLFHMQHPEKHIIEGKPNAKDTSKEEKFEGKPVMHYAWISNMSDVLGKVKTTQRGDYYKHVKHLCFNCFLQFHSQEVLANHISWCHLEASHVKQLPEPGEVYKYVGTKHEIKFPWFFVFDFECLQVLPKSACSCKPELKHKCEHKTSTVTVQEPFAYGFVMIDRYGNICEEISYVGEDAAEHFVETVFRMQTKYKFKIRNGYKKLIVTDEIERRFREAEECYLCCKLFETAPLTPLDIMLDRKAKKLEMVKDHDHLTGEYLGAAHNLCNLQRVEVGEKLVGFAHNFSSYDSHCIIKAIAKKRNQGDFDGRYFRLKAIPLNTQRFKILTLNGVMLLDSMSFLNDSLERLVDNLRASNHTFDLVKQWLSNDEKRELVLRKGIFPYEAMTSMKVLKEKQLPPRESFASKLTGSTGASSVDYQHAQTVWNTFECKNMEDYSRLYVMSDCYLLMEALCELRNTLFEEFHLDMCHYFSLPMMAKEMLFKSTGAEVELLTDPEMINMIRANIRGGLSFSNLRHCDIKEESEKRQEPVVLAYLDCVNLYGYAMSQKMPIGEFEWMSVEQISGFDPMVDVCPDSDTGFIVDCTLEYPSCYHAVHNSMPLAAHRQEITGDMLSKYARSALTAQNRKPQNYKANKLTSSYLTRDRYVCHGVNLKLYLELGMKLVAIHRIIKFKQDDFIRPYIEFCSKMRAESKTKTRSTIFKLLANAVYGKLIENSNNRMDSIFVYTRTAALRRNTDPRLRGQLILEEDFSIAFLAKKLVKLNQMWPVGFSVLELSKAHMLSLYYKELLPAFHGKVSVVMSDTDSYLVMLASPSVDDAITKLMHVMDTSNYPKDHMLYDDSRKNQPGLLKNECPANDIIEAVAIRSKVYAFRTENDNVDTRCKGIKKSVGRAIAFAEFKNIVLNEEPQVMSVTQHMIQAKNHVNMLVKSTKVAMTSFDDKRSLNMCGLHSLPYGSKLMESQTEEGCIYCENPLLYS